MTGKTRVFAVFGCPVEHSLSPRMHNAAIQALELDAVYVPFRVEAENLSEAVRGIRSMGFGGVNLTIPLKEHAVSLVDELSPEAAKIQAVNTLWWKDGRLMGHSTDGDGFLLSLEKAMGTIPSSALVLGAGGSARGVCNALASRGVRLTIANRTTDRAKKLIDELQLPNAGVCSTSEADLRISADDAELIVNSTSVGMTPNIDDTPLPDGVIQKGHFVYDLVYNPPVTRLLQQASDAGAEYINGLDMLVYQGALSFQLWTGIWPPVEIMKAAIVSQD